MTATSRHVVLRRHPTGRLSPDDFELVERPFAPLAAGQFRTRNRFLSLDAGFRQWMNAGSSDNYLAEMPLGEPVQSIVLGEVIESRHADWPEGRWVLARTAWESHSVTDGSDLATPVEPLPGVPLEEHLGALGPAGMTAYFGLFAVGRLVPGDRVLVSAAAGGVGSLVGQLARIAGCRPVGIAGGERKCRFLVEQLGYAAAVDHRAHGDLAAAIAAACPEGVDLYFDNVGGRVLDAALANLREGARVVLCGMVSQYEGEAAPIHRLWQLVTKRAEARGFMFSDFLPQFAEAAERLGRWVQEGRLSTPFHVTEGLENAPRAFCEMLAGANLGKAIVRL
ncbi:MAG: NADP-dependent oxidoreductase [Porticoccaceae bacterium]|nr:MAG: NADP-dependent oxidoreductase [Porticoccaceae bacterium]